MKSEPNITTNIDLSFLSIKKQRIVYAHYKLGTRMEDGTQGPPLNTTIPWCNGERMYRVNEIDVIKGICICARGRNPEKSTVTFTGICEIREKV